MQILKPDHLVQLDDAFRCATGDGGRIATRWRVVTGPPFSGKTTLVQEMARKGVKVIPDCGRIAIEEQLSTGKNKYQVRMDYEELQIRISELMIIAARSIRSDELVIWDYSFPDNLAYMAAANADWSAHHLQRAAAFQFDRVLVLPPLPIDHNVSEDPVRTESPRIRKQLFEAITETYRRLGNETITLETITDISSLQTLLTN